MKTLRPCLLSLLTVAALACGETPGGPDETASLVRVSGTILNEKKVAVEGPLRMALVWGDIGQEDSLIYDVAQEVEVAPQFPASFSLALSDPPPASAVHEFGGPFRSFRAAVGQLVAYEDRNGNGQLDIVRQGDPVYIDRIVGNVGGDRPTAFVLWLEPEDVAKADAAVKSSDNHNNSKPVAGYNLLVDEPNDPIGAHWFSAETPVRLMLDDGPGMQLLMCAEGTYHGHYQDLPGTADNAQVGPGPNGWPRKADWDLDCGVGAPTNPDGTFTPVLSYTECVVEAPEVCVVRRTQCTKTFWSKPTDPVAAKGWPCD